MITPLNVILLAILIYGIVVLLGCSGIAFVDLVNNWFKNRSDEENYNG